MESKNLFVDLDSKELYHYGIMGQKWGVRRYQPYSVRGRKGGKGGREIGEARKLSDNKSNKSRRHQWGRGENSYKQDNKNKVSSRYIKKYIKKREKQMIRDVKNRRFLSDKDLQRKINRIKMEQELKNLTEEALRPGKLATKKVLKESGQDLARYVLVDIGKSTYRVLKNSLGEEKTETIKRNYYKNKEEKRKNKK